MEINEPQDPIHEDRDQAGQDLNGHDTPDQDSPDWLDLDRWADDGGNNLGNVGI